MPERVRTRFEDDDDSPKAQKTPVGRPAKKRKADEAFQLSTVKNHDFAGPKVVNFQEKQGLPTDEPPAVDAKRPENIKGALKQRAIDLLAVRRRLPIFAHAEEIRNALRRQDALLLVGETGSGKSTQVPQFLFNESWCKPESVSINTANPNDGKVRHLSKTVKVGGCIAITQPRRVAAISLARRVAEEMGTPLGSSSPASQVGYSVRFDNSTSPSTRIKFLTEGMLLQEMLRDPWLKEYSAVVVDEVHERGVNVDLVLGFLKQMSEGKKEGRGGVVMKVVIMSATADMVKIQDFFNHSHTAAETDDNGMPNGHVNGNKEDNTSTGSESEWSGFSDRETKSPPSSKTGRKATAKTSSEDPSVAVCYIKGRQYPVQTIYTITPVADWVDAAFQRIVDIHLHQPLPGDILVFLTGQETVESLESLCNEYAHTLHTSKDPKLKSLPKLLILPLFAALPQSAQQRVFTPTPRHTRKVILATNIAETSITVPGIRHVIDSGKHKRKQFRSRLNLDSLLVKPISKSSANQRKGRAGREAPGSCYRLYTESDYLALPADNDPEILRCDLTQVLLALKARDVDDVTSYPWLTPPRRPALEQALLQLLSLKALDPTNGTITPLGLAIAHLPLPAGLARVLLAAADPQYDCLSETIDIVSALSVESLFLNTTTTRGISDEKRDAIDSLRRELQAREGDHLTLLATVQAYAAEQTDRKRWCEARAVSHRAMQGVMDVRKQLTGLMKKYQRQHRHQQPSSAPSPSSPPLPTRILHAFLTGFSLNLARLMPDGSYKTFISNQSIAIHPSSVLFGRRVEAIMYHEFVWTQKGYARNVSAVEMGWIGQ